LWSLVFEVGGGKGIYPAKTCIESSIGGGRCWEKGGISSLSVCV
jgi:hypothetical protein